MRHPSRFRFTMFGALIAISSAIVYAASSEPNAQPNPYRTIENWAKLPEGRTWGSAAGVDLDPHGHIWVAERCGANSCDGKTDDPILEFDASGKLQNRIIGLAVAGIRAAALCHPDMTM